MRKLSRAVLACVSIGASAGCQDTNRCDAVARHVSELQRTEAQRIPPAVRDQVLALQHAAVIARATDCAVAEGKYSGCLLAARTLDDASSCAAVPQ